MTSLLNLSLIEGHLTRDPELFYTKAGNALCKFDIAVNSFTKNGDENKQETTFLSVTTWNKVAESTATYLKKGSLIRVKGRLKQQSWEDKEGNKRSKIQVEAQSVEFLTSPKRNET